MLIEQGTASAIGGAHDFPLASYEHIGAEADFLTDRQICSYPGQWERLKATFPGPSAYDTLTATLAREECFQRRLQGRIGASPEWIAMVRPKRKRK